MTMLLLSWWERVVEGVAAHPDSELILQLIVALSLGVLLGAERTLAKKAAGMRTHALVAMAAALFVGLGIRVADQTDGDLLRILQGVVTGVGFLGAGVILFDRAHVRGLTTAAGLWFTAGVGVAVALRAYVVALSATALVLFVYRVLWKVEEEMKERLITSQSDQQSFS